jgi:hypothetical protein
MDEQFDVMDRGAGPFTGKEAAWPGKCWPIISDGQVSEWEN